MNRPACSKLSKRLKETELRNKKREKVEYIQATLAVLVGIGLLVAIVYLLGVSDILLGFVREAQVKLILQNEQFVKAIMSSDIYVFEQDMHHLQLQGRFIVQIKDSDRTDADRWNIYSPTGSETPNQGFMGFHWIGLPPFRTVYKYKQVETVYEQKGNPDGGRMDVVEKTFDHHYNYIPLEEMTLVLLVKEAETYENLPVNVKCSVTLRIVNPYKAAFRANPWLRTVFDQLGPEIRTLIGLMKYEHLNDKRTSAENINKYIRGSNVELNGSRVESEDFFYRWIVDYGVAILRVQIQTVEPASALAEQFIQASTAQYVERERAKAEARRLQIVAKGEAKRITTLATARAEEIRTLKDAELERIQAIYAAIAKHGAEGSYVRFAEALERTNIDYLSLGSGAMPPAVSLPPKTD